MATPSDTFDDGLDEDDINHFINELQRIIHEAPSGLESGMQGRFARTISYLQSKKLAMIENKTIPKVEIVDKKQLLEELMVIIDNLKSQNQTPEKFRKLMQLTQLREKISQEKRQNRPTLPNSGPSM